MGDYESSRCDNLESILRDTSAQPCDLRLQYLKDITNDFSIERELGRGGSAVVYKGVLHNGEMIAVKNLVSMSEVQEKHFKSEVDNLMRVKHQNIVRFVGYCYETWHEYIEYNGLRVFADKPKRLLCFEYMPNGSLDRYISEESCGLDWRNRYKIIKGICSGLHYLHKECEINASVIHLDLKPANILLDDNMVPKIADFGLSRLFNDTKIETRATTLAGSYGYMAPEYLCNRIITTKADIYSLGVIIIEMITGRRISPFDVVTTWRDFMEPVRKNWRKRLEAAARYTSLEIECEQIKSSLEIGLSCIKINRIERPTTVEIMESLIRWESTNCYVSDEEKPPADKVLQRDNVMKKFQEVIAQLEHSLFDFPYEKLDGSDKVREQVELVHAQLKRTKRRFEMPGDEFYDDILSNKSYSPSTELDIPKRLSEKLHLTTITDLTQEWLALHEMVASGCGQDPGEHIEKTSMLLKKIEDSVQTQNPDTGPPIVSKLMDSNGDPRPVIIPDQFRCPISLELMTDPVVVVTGQTYERAHIEEWLASGYRICPATQQRLTSTTLTPNYILRSLIVQWCKTNRIEPPKRSLSESANIDVLTSQLCSPDTEQQRSAAAELRLLAKCSANNRICIAESGAIPLLLSLLSSSDLQTQEHAVTALLNLSIHADNKTIIVSSGAVPSIVDILKNGSMEARENAAATLFSLSVFNEYKVTIGEAGAIPALVVLLSQGSQQAKKDAAAALFNLCIYQGNKGRAIRAGLVPIIMGLLANPTGGLMDEAMAILSILSSHPEGKVAIWASEPVPVLVETIGSGSPRNRENAATVMLHLCIGGQQLAPFTRAQECGIIGPLRELAMNGTERGKKKAVQLLELMNRFLVQQQEAKEAQLQRHRHRPPGRRTGPD